MKKKLGLLMALLHRPSLLILDEPTNGLDVESTHQFFEMMRELACDGTTILFSTHLLDQVERLCSHAAVIHTGRIVASGSLDAIPCRMTATICGPIGSMTTSPSAVSASASGRNTSKLICGRRLPTPICPAPFSPTQCGAQFAEVQVDTWTGIVQVTRMLGVQDCGLVIAKKLAESQVLGAMIQGVSYALHEQRIMDKRSGRLVNGDFLRYKVTGTQDLPQLECHLHSIANGHDSVGAAGLGVPPSVASAAAVVSHDSDESLQWPRFQRAIGGACIFSGGNR
jgi:hypothetical protein